MKKEQFISLVNEKKNHGRIVNIISERACKTKKGVEDIITVKKTVSVQLGCSYSNIVTNRAKAEGVEDTLNLQNLPDYLTRINKFITQHKTKNTYYLDAMPISGKSQYFVNGEEIDCTDEIKDMVYSGELPRKRENKSGGSQGDLKKRVEWRRFSLDNIKSVSINKTVIKIED